MWSVSPSRKFLYFTVVDAGETIPYNVERYIEKYGMDKVNNYLDWAIQEGNSTRDSCAPGGIGLSLIKDFISLNKGELHIVSGEDIFEYNSRGERYRKMDYSFPGTIVTLAFNLGDESKYYFTHEDIDQIEF